MTNAREGALVLIVSACLLLAGVARGDLELSGYTQARLNCHDSDLDKADEFDLRRVRLKAKGPVNEDGTTVTVQVDLSKLDDPGGGDITFKDAKIEHTFSTRWHARLGYASVPFGIEVPYSSRKRLPLERSQAAKEFFPGERDNGLYFTHHPERPDQPALTVGYSNGLHKWRSADREAHALVVGVQWPLPNEGCAGISYMAATRTRQDADTQQNIRYDNDVWGAHMRWNGEDALSIFSFQGETYHGKLLGVDASGWYTMGEATPPNVPATLFYRYDRFNDGDPAHQVYRRHTAGVASEPAENTRITLQWENYHHYTGRAYSSYALQWQANY